MSQQFYCENKWVSFETYLNRGKGKEEVHVQDSTKMSPVW